MYIGTPIGKPKVELNVHRIYNPNDIVNLLASIGIELVQFCTYNRDRDSLYEKMKLDECAMSDGYMLGLFIFKRKTF